MSFIARLPKESLLPSKSALPSESMLTSYDEDDKQVASSQGFSTASTISPALLPSSSSFEEYRLFFSSLQSTAVMQVGVASGPLNVENNKKMLNEIQQIASQTLKETIDVNQKISKQIDSYEKMTEEGSMAYSEVALSLLRKIRENPAQNLSKEELGHVTLTRDIAAQVRDYYYETTKQYLEIQGLHTNTYFADYRKAIDLIFYTRKLEIDLFKMQVEQLREQENHELKIATETLETNLKLELQAFDEMMQVAKFNSEENQKTFDNSFRRQDQKNTFELAKRKQSDERNTNNKKIRLEYKIQKKELTIQEKIEKKKLKLEKYGMHTKRRLGFIKALGSLISKRKS